MRIIKRFGSWLWTVLWRFWGWVGAASAAVFLLGLVPKIKPLIDTALGRDNDRWFLRGGIAMFVFSAFLAWNDQQNEIERYTHPSLRLEFNPGAPGFLQPALAAEGQPALYVRVLPVTETRVDGCRGYLEAVFRQVGETWVPVCGFGDKLSLHWSDVPGQRSSEVSIAENSRQFLDVVSLRQRENVIRLAADTVPLSAAGAFVQHADDVFKLVVRVVGASHAQATIELQIQRTWDWSEPRVQRIN